MKKFISYLSRLCSPGVGLQNDESSTRLRLVIDSFTCRYRLSMHLCCILMAVFLLTGAGDAWGGISVLSFTSSSATPNSGTSYTDDQSNSWTINHDSDYKTIDGDAIHVGSSSKTASYLKATSSSFSGVTVTSVVVNAKQNGTGSVDVKINNSAFGGSAQSLTNSYADYTFTGSVAVTGNIVANLSRASATKKNFFLKTLTVTYLTAITLNKNDGVSNGAAKFDHNATAYATSSFTAVTRDGYTCTGYWTATSGGTKILNANGTLAAANITVSTVPYISSSKWVYAGKTLTLYAQWEADAACSTEPGVGGSSNGSLIWTCLFARFYRHCAQCINHLPSRKKTYKYSFSAHLSTTDFQQVTTPLIQTSSPSSHFMPFFALFFVIYLHHFNDHSVTYFQCLTVAL